MPNKILIFGRLSPLYWLSRAHSNARSSIYFTQLRLRPYGSAGQTSAAPSVSKRCMTHFRLCLELVSARFGARRDTLATHSLVQLFVFDFLASQSTRSAGCSPAFSQLPSGNRVSLGKVETNLRRRHLYWQNHNANRLRHFIGGTR